MTTRRVADPNGPREGRFVRVLKWCSTALIALLIVGLAAAGVIYVATPIPNPNKDFNTYNTHLYFADGKTDLGTLSVQNREVLSYAQMPQNMKDAIVAAENPTFWTDPGISIQGIARAVTTLDQGADAQGGSTITQQYVKILYLSQERTLTRKLKEMVIALKLGQEQSKEQILEGYLNTVYYGRGAYGLGAAAKAYFDVTDVSKLTEQQALVLAALINAPGRMDPALGASAVDELTQRYQYIINQLVKTGKMTEADKATIYTTLPAFAANKKDPRYGGTNGYLMKMVESELKSLGYDEATINGGGLDVTTTFTKTDQDAAVATAQAQVKAAAAENGKDASKLHASIVSIDNATGGVLALYAGNNDYVTASRNWATTTAPTGSTFKTWVLTAALRQGVSMDKQLKGYTFTAADGAQVTGETDGEVSLQEAITNSINSAFVDLATQLQDGGPSSIKAANDAGIPGTAGKDGWDADIRVGMGTAQVSPVDQASGYSTLANDGVHVPWHVVAQVKDATGKVLYQAAPQGTQGIEKNVATQVTSALEQVTQTGTGKAVGALDWPVAGKTGTRYDGVGTRSSWFVGYTKQITTAVNFRAGDTGNDNLDDYSQGFYGAGYPAETWLAFMQTAMKGLPQQDFTASSYTPTAPTSQSSSPSARVVPPATVSPNAPTSAAKTPSRASSTPAPATTSASPTTRATPSARPTQASTPQTTP